MKVLIVEDSSAIREILQTILAEIPALEVIGQEESETGAIKAVVNLRPDVVILDISLKPGSGISVLEYIKKNHPEMVVMILTNYTDDFYFRRCKESGADYFFDKTFQIKQVRAAFWNLVYKRHEDGKQPGQSDGSQPASAVAFVQ